MARRGARPVDGTPARVLAHRGHRRRARDEALARHHEGAAAPGRQRHAGAPRPARLRRRGARRTRAANASSRPCWASWARAAPTARTPSRCADGGTGRTARRAGSRTRTCRHDLRRGLRRQARGALPPRALGHARRRLRRRGPRGRRRRISPWVVLFHGLEGSSGLALRAHADAPRGGARLARHGRATSAAAAASPTACRAPTTRATPTRWTGSLRRLQPLADGRAALRGRRLARRQRAPQVAGRAGRRGGARSSRAPPRSPRRSTSWPRATRSGAASRSSTRGTSSPR